MKTITRSLLSIAIVLLFASTAYAAPATFKLTGARVVDVQPVQHDLVGSYTVLTVRSHTDTGDLEDVEIRCSGDTLAQQCSGWLGKRLNVSGEILSYLNAPGSRQYVFIPQAISVAAGK